jgi:arsenate reductase
MNRKKKVLFLCTGNSCRSQMAESLLRRIADDRFECLSAGLDPAPGVHPLAIRVMKEIGVDLGAQKPKHVSVFLGKEPVNFLITVCDKAKASCPRVWPGMPQEHRLYWPFDDPADAAGSEEEKITVFRRVRDEIGGCLERWVETLP